MMKRKKRKPIHLGRWMLPEEARETWIKEEEYYEEMFQYWKLTDSGNKVYWPTSIKVNIFTCDLLKLNCTNPLDKLTLTPNPASALCNQNSFPIYTTGNTPSDLQLTYNKQSGDWLLQGSCLTNAVKKNSQISKSAKCNGACPTSPTPSMLDKLRGIHIWSGLSLVHIQLIKGVSKTLHYYGCTNPNTNDNGCTPCGAGVHSNYPPDCDKKCSSSPTPPPSPPPPPPPTAPEV